MVCFFQDTAESGILLLPLQSGMSDPDCISVKHGVFVVGVTTQASETGRQAPRSCVSPMERKAGYAKKGVMEIR